MIGASAWAGCPARSLCCLIGKIAAVRRRPHGNYLIFYRVGAEQVEILHVLHGARDYEPILFPAS